MAVHLEHRHPVGNRVVLVLHLLVGVDIIAHFNWNLISISVFFQFQFSCFNVHFLAFYFISFMLHVSCFELEVSTPDCGT